MWVDVYRPTNTFSWLAFFSGGFDSEHEAALAYDIACVRFRGHEAQTNYAISGYQYELEHLTEVNSLLHMYPESRPFLGALLRDSAGSTEWKHWTQSKQAAIHLRQPVQGATFIRFWHSFVHWVQHFSRKPIVYGELAFILDSCSTLLLAKANCSYSCYPCAQAITP